MADPQTDYSVFIGCFDGGRAHRRGLCELTAHRLFNATTERKDVMCASLHFRGAFVRMYEAPTNQD